MSALPLPDLTPQRPRLRRPYRRRMPGPYATHVPLWLACEIWGCSPSMLYMWRKKGLLPASGFIGSGRGTRVLRTLIENPRPERP